RVVGTAFDWRLRYYVTPTPGPDLALTVSAPADRAAFLSALDDAVRRTRPVGRRLNRFEEDVLNRACLSLALTEENGRDGATFSSETFATGAGWRHRRELPAACESWLGDLRALSWAAHETLGERLSLPSVVSPTFV